MAAYARATPPRPQASRTQRAIDRGGESYYFPAGKLGEPRQGAERPTGGGMGLPRVATL
jgi:hypothetical protein